MNRTRRIAVIVAVFGILLELVAVFLLSSRRLTASGAMPLIIVGMFLAFIPMFIATRRRR